MNERNRGRTYWIPPETNLICLTADAAAEWYGAEKGRPMPRMYWLGGPTGRGAKLAAEVPPDPPPKGAA